MLNEYEARRADLRERSRKALEQGRDILRNESGEDVQLPKDMGRVVWRLLQDAAETLERLPDRDRAWLRSGDRAAWPTIARTFQERFEVEVERLQDGITEEEAPLSELRKRFAITDTRAEDRAFTVLEWFTWVRSRKPRRDKAVVLALASGASQKLVRRLMEGRGHSAAHMVKIKSINHIAKGLSNLIFSTD